MPLRCDVAVGFEPEPGMLVDSMPAFEELLRRIDAAEPAADARHRPPSVPRASRSWKRSAAGRRGWSTSTSKTCGAGAHEHLMFGEGEIDFPPVVRTLAAAGYTGGLYVELSRHSHEGPTAAAKGVRFPATDSWRPGRRPLDAVRTPWG